MSQHTSQKRLPYSNETLPHFQCFTLLSTVKKQIYVLQNNHLSKIKINTHKLNTLISWRHHEEKINGTLPLVIRLCLSLLCISFTSVTLALPIRGESNIGI